MSTKIYNAYKYSGSPEELMKWLIKFRERYEDMAVEELYPLFISASKYAKINLDVKEPDSFFEEPQNYFSTSRGIKEIIKRGYNEPLNIEASVAVYFHNSLTIVQFFGLDFGSKGYSKKLRERIIKNKNLRESIVKNKKFIDFSYWNNTDPPEKVSDEEWDERRDFYDSLIKNYHFFNSVGLVYELSNTESISDICYRVSEKIHENEHENEI